MLLCFATELWVPNTISYLIWYLAYLLNNLAVINDLIICQIQNYYKAIWHSYIPEIIQKVIDEYRKREGITFVLIEMIGRNYCLRVFVYLTICIL